MPFTAPLGFWIVVLVLMVIVLVLQDATEYSAPGWIADLLNDAGFYIILLFLVVGFVLRLRHYHQSPYLFWRGLSWFLAAFGCWWLFFRDDSPDPPQK